MAEEEPQIQQEPKSQDLPEFTLANVLNDGKDALYGLIFDPEFNRIVLPAVWILESLLVKLIRAHVAYTEIDYTAYMEQIDIIKSGELDYENIYGGTGPLVYPAGHVAIYRCMSWITNGSEGIQFGQMIFSWLYMLNLFLVLLIYSKLNLKPWVGMLLMLSKRLHSIYILRLFNDCFTTLFMVLTVLTLQYAGSFKNSYSKGSHILSNYVSPSFFSIAISIKMNGLLYLPGYLLIMYFLNNEAILSLVVPLVIMVFWQVLIGWDFLFNGSVVRESYINNAFNFGRQFMYKWTVNFRFLSEDTFNCPEFHQLLLASHISLILFFLFTKWVKPAATGKPISQIIKDGIRVYSPTLNTNHIITDTVQGPRYIMGVMASCNLIGVLCARSLHYQFLSWYAWTYPFLLGSSNVSIVLGLTLWFAHEWCWNVYPSSIESSVLLVVCNVVTLVLYWFSNDDKTAGKPQQPLQNDKLQKKLK